jgi:hypothetical protein
VSTVSVSDRAIAGGSAPRSITVDHGTEFMSRALEDWAYRRGVQLDFIRPGKSVENAFIESLNGRLSARRFERAPFTSIEDAKAKIEAWRIDYNQRRPLSSLGHLTPNEFEQQTSEITGCGSRVSLASIVSNGTNVNRAASLLSNCPLDGGAYASSARVRCSQSRNAHGGVRRQWNSIALRTLRRKNCWGCSWSADRTAEIMAAAKFFAKNAPVGNGGNCITAARSCRMTASDERACGRFLGRTAPADR